MSSGCVRGVRAGSLVTFFNGYDYKVFNTCNPDRRIDVIGDLTPLGLVIESRRPRKNCAYGWLRVLTQVGVVGWVEDDLVGAVLS